MHPYGVPFISSLMNAEDTLPALKLIVGRMIENHSRANMSIPSGTLRGEFPLIQVAAVDVLPLEAAREHRTSHLYEMAPLDMSMYVY